MMPENMGRVTFDLVGVMPRCKDCRWWDANEEDQGYIAKNYGIPEGGICRRFEEPDAGAFMYGYVSDAVIATRSDYGCVQFEAKP